MAQAAVRTKTSDTTTVIDTRDIESWPLERLVNVTKQLDTIRATVTAALQEKVATYENPTIAEAKALLKIRRGGGGRTPGTLNFTRGKSMDECFKHLLTTDFFKTKRTAKEVQEAVIKLGYVLRDGGKGFVYNPLCRATKMGLLRRESVSGKQGGAYFFNTKKAPRNLTAWK